MSIFELLSADRRGRNRNLSEMLAHVNFVYENVNHKRKRCATACRQQCTPLLVFERITMDHVDETVLMVSGWDVPRTEPVVQSRRFYAPPYQTFPSIPYLYAISCRNESPHRYDWTTDEQLRIPIPTICVTFLSITAIRFLGSTGIHPTNDISDHCSTCIAGVRKEDRGILIFVAHLKNEIQG